MLTSTSAIRQAACKVMLLLKASSGFLSPKAIICWAKLD
ncbi:hypothetical protein CECT5772_03654 [Streptococcus equi subsp. ruminatorum CECT 5772]|uniref:Uncharacterized protein n=1 Tax=Streptococcus equi subsp. ruminatorum CECT 5772 TaxID=1051981 RepID=A0A922NVI2_9STRE|nr:hypothetical protein CECT5772_03654 [Streptococcus equi subsp. ruminatorum CECT 5772]